MAAPLINSIKTQIGLLLREPTSNPIIQFIRSGFVGVFSLIVDFTSLYILTDICGIYYLISAALSFVGGISSNYLLSIFWVFTVRKFGNRKLEFMIFSIIGAIGLLLNELIMWYFTERYFFHYLTSKLIATVLVFFFNFFSRRRFLFS